jgi:cytoskeleton protein RodZ
MTEEIEQDIKNEPEEVTMPGQLLAKARQDAGLSLEEVSEQLKIPLNVLKNIESDVAYDTLPEAFVRGYIRAYAKKVNVDESLVLQKKETTGAIDTSGLEMQSFSRRTKRKALERRLTIASWIIAIVLVIALVIWWFQDGGFNRFAPVATTTATEQNKATEVAMPVSFEPEDAQSPQPISEYDLSTVAASDEEMSDEEESEANSSEQNPMDSSGEESQVSSVVSGTEQDSTLSSDSVVAEQPQTVVSLTPEQQALVAADGAADESGFIKVEMKFDELCYVEVRDVSGEQVAYGNKPAGYLMSLNAQGPLSVLLGHTQGVTIWVNDKEYDMSDLPRNRVARFELEAASVE